jgi:hypothetical protein
MHRNSQLKALKLLEEVEEDIHRNSDFLGHRCCFIGSFYLVHCYQKEADEL